MDKVKYHVSRGSRHQIQSGPRLCSDHQQYWLQASKNQYLSWEQIRSIMLSRECHSEKFFLLPLLGVADYVLVVCINQATETIQV